MVPQSIAIIDDAWKIRGYIFKKTVLATKFVKIFSLENHQLTVDKSQLHNFLLAINWSALNNKLSFAPTCKFIVTALIFILFDSHSFSLTAASTWPQLLNPYLHTCMYKENYNRNLTYQLLVTYAQYTICLTGRWSALSLLYTGTDVGFYERG